MKKRLSNNVLQIASQKACKGCISSRPHLSYALNDVLILLLRIQSLIRPER